MTEKRPISFKIFIATISITALVFLTATILSYYHFDKKYAMILAIVMILALSFTTVGIYSGLKHRTEEKKFKMFNRIGLIGNALIFLFIIGLMIMAFNNVPKSH